MNQGLVHYYYGNGNGKTSIALGHIVRAYGHNLRILLIQFLKKQGNGDNIGFKCGEHITLTKHLGVKVLQFGDYNFVESGNISENLREELLHGVDIYKNILQSKLYDIVILDEVLSLIKLGIYNVENLVKDISLKDPRVEVIITGRPEYKKIRDISNYVVELKEIKHPFSQGILARVGIDY